MNIVDSCGWLEFFADGPNSEHFAPIIQDTRNLVVPTISITEVFRCIVQQKDEDLALQAIALMHQGHVAELTSAIAVSAAQLGIQHHLPLADSVIYSTSRHYKAIIYTQDADFENLNNVCYFKKAI